VLFILAEIGVIIMLGLPRAAHADDAPFSEIIVTGQRREQSLMQHTGNAAVLDAEVIGEVRHQHVHELMTRVPGVWISRGSGQEHLTAIRSPVLTGAGSCGGFLFLEDSIPIRPAGFCNVNEMFELDTEQAHAIEVIRGPGNALYGSNALHGIVNVLMPGPGNRNAAGGSLEIGAHRFLRLMAELPRAVESPYFASAVFADDGGFRDDSGYRQGKLHLKARGEILGGELLAAFSATGLDQQTAGFIVGADAYRDPDINRTNPNPEAFREAASQRLYAVWSRRGHNRTFDIRPFLRHSDTTFLQHFLPGQPLEDNGHRSAGAMGSVTIDSKRTTSVLGMDLEWSNVYLRETQEGPAEGSDFLRETRPVGKHYDFRVTSVSAAPYVQTDIRFGEALTIGVGLRAEWLHYEYDNRMLDGNTRDDGTACGFGGCLYTRPADRTDRFVNVVPKLSASYRIGRADTLYLVAARGFRAPQMTELYRLQSGQQVADLKSELIDSVEVGLRQARGGLALEVDLYAMRKRNSVFRDAEGFNVSGARTRHEGAEAGVDWQLSQHWRLGVDASYARHRYDFDTVAALGEMFTSGKDVDTAPRWLGSAELHYDNGRRLRAALQWVTLGRYYLDAENRFDYPGHSLLNLRVTLDATQRFGLSARLNNVTGRAYADRADYAFGDYRYFPGRGRELFVELRYLFDRSD